MLGSENTPTPVTLKVAAMFNENPDMIRALVDAGADPQCEGCQWRYAPGYCDEIRMNPEVAQALVDAGAETLEGFEGLRG